MSMKHVLTILVENRPGVLARVADLFSARGYGIDSLTAAQTMDPALLSITCSTTSGERLADKIVKHLRRLIDVVHVARFPAGSLDFVAREMLLVKLRAIGSERTEILRLAEIFRARVVDVRAENLTIEVTGNPRKLNAMLEALKPMGIEEIARTGQVAVARGEALEPFIMKPSAAMDPCESIQKNERRKSWQRSTSAV